jgi:hypothetical protein
MFLPELIASLIITLHEADWGKSDFEVSMACCRLLSHEAE